MTTLEAKARFCVCVPAKNEEGRLAALLLSLANQSLPGVIPISICINNSADGSERIAKQVAAKYVDRLSVELDVVTFPDDLAHVGSARRRAMDKGAALCDQGGFLISTDADVRLPKQWLSANLSAFGRGASIVGGRLVLDETEPLSEAEERCREHWDAYWDRVRQVEDTIDPRAWDLPPRHGDHTGASLALSADLYKRAGGVPLLQTGEDVALVRSAVAAGGKLSHPDDVWVWVSTRREGRAPGGMAEAMATLHQLAEDGRPLMVPALKHWRRRAEWRRKVRLEHGSDAWVMIEEAKLPPLPSDMALSQVRSLV